MTEPPAPIRTYVRRLGRITPAQERAHSEFAATFCIPFTGAKLDLQHAFGREAPLLIEVGFGMGHALLETATAKPDWNHLGIEVYRPGVGALIKGAVDRGLTNLRVIEGDAVAVLEQGIAPASVAQLHIFFADPWPKTKHHKRRLIQAPFVGTAARRLIPGGMLLLATDWRPYADAMLEVLDAEPLLRNAAGPGAISLRPAERPSTRFERRGVALGHEIADLVYRRIDVDAVSAD